MAKRLGRIEFNIGYVVDFDDDDMISHAKDAILEDVINALNEGLQYNIIHNNPSNPMTEGDIPSFLLDDNDLDDHEDDDYIFGEE